MSRSRVNIVLVSKFSFAFTTLRFTPADRWIPPGADGMVDRHGGVSAQVKRHTPKGTSVRYEGRNASLSFATARQGFARLVAMYVTTSQALRMPMKISNMMPPARVN